jgi:dipeptidyl-peptidase-4
MIRILFTRPAFGIGGLALVCLVLWPPLPSPAFESKRELSVERIYGDPPLSGEVPSRIRWRPDGEAVTGLEDETTDGGERNVLWLWEVPSGEKRALLRADDEVLEREGGAVSIKEYVWAPDSRRLLLPSGGDLYLYDVEDGSLSRLTETEAEEKDPKFSPDGAWISFVRDNDLFVLEPGTGEERRLTRDGSEEILNGTLDWVYEEEFSFSSAYWWSPDSQSIAYLSLDQSPVSTFPLTDFIPVHNRVTWEHYPKAGDDNSLVRVGVVAVETAGTVWMDLGDDPDIYIPRVCWVPPTGEVAIQRLNRDQTRLDLLFADPESGESRTILTESTDTFINIRDQAHFFEDRERFLWYSERDGWQHLYLYDLAGRLQNRVTSGEWMVTALDRMDEDDDRVYFTATRETPVERHLYRVKLDGSDLERLSDEAGTHASTPSPGGKYYVDEYSSLTHPPRTALHRADGRRSFWIDENPVPELEEYGLSRPEIVTFEAEDGTSFFGRITRPYLFDPAKRYPVIVYVYGGPHAQVVRNRWGRARNLWHLMMAQKGFVVFEMDNRGSFARGKAWEETIFRKMGTLEVEDQLRGVEYLESLPYVDPERIGVWGWSYGGYMTLLCLMKGGGAYKAGVSVAPVTDWKFYDTIYTERYMDRPRDNEEGYEAGAPITHVQGLTAPLLLVHGTGDDNVHFANSVALVDELIEAGKDFDLMIYPGRLHGIRDDEARMHLFRRITAFFLEHL